MGRQMDRPTNWQKTNDMKDELYQMQHENEEE